MKWECGFENVIKCQKGPKANRRGGTKSVLENYSAAKHNATISSRICFSFLHTDNETEHF